MVGNVIMMVSGFTIYFALVLWQTRPPHRAVKKMNR
jgi:hypothetical protein